LPIETKVQGQMSLAIIFQQNRDICAHGIYATWSKFQHIQKMHPLLKYKTIKFQISATTHIETARIAFKKAIRKLNIAISELYYLPHS